MPDTTSQTEMQRLIDRAVCLDFVNTIDGRIGPSPQDHLASYADLVAWSRQAGTLDEAEAGRLLAAAARRPDDASAALGRALALREAIFRVFSAVAGDRAPALADLADLNAALAAALARLQVGPAGDGFAWRWAGPPDDLDRPLWPLARAAGDLLTSDQLDRVRECASETCGWLFVDLSRNRSRRWCDMSDCGNRAKARRFYERRRKDRA